MLEREMEDAVAKCPEIFIEPGLTLVKRQVVINGRRPDLLFADTHSRHLLVEIQRGRLDEDHIQRHFYYYYDYRAKYSSTHLRLMFIANVMHSRHKDFLDEHGYEFREYPERFFEQRVAQCNNKSSLTSVDTELVTSEEVPSPFLHELLYEIEKQKMTMCYKMLLLINMVDLADGSGRVPLRSVAECFQEFFINRVRLNKAEENPNRVEEESLSLRHLSKWERVIVEQPVLHLGSAFVLNEGMTLRWANRIFDQWSAEMGREIRRAALNRLIQYFDRHVPGGY